MKYAIQNDTGRLLGIFLHQFERYVLYIANIAIIVRFISPVFIIITYYCVFMLESDSSTKIRNNIVESLFCIPGAIAEHEDNSRVNLIVESEIGLL